MRHDVALALLGAGVAVAVAAALGALVMRSTYGRLHFLTPVTSAAGPLVGVGLAVDLGWGLPAGLVLFVVALLAAGGPVLGAETARLAAQHDGLIRPESPE